MAWSRGDKVLAPEYPGVVGTVITPGECQSEVRFPGIGERILINRSLKAEATAKPTKKKKVGHAVDVAFEFEARDGSNRKKLLEALAASFGKDVAIANLVRVVYHSPDVEQYRGALNNVVKGAIDTIAKKKLPYAIVKSKDTITLKGSQDG